MIKINYIKRWSNGGYCFTQTIKIPLKIYEELQNKIISEIILKYPLKKKYCETETDYIYLKEINNNFDYLNLTTLRFISLYLKNKRLKLNRNTIIEVIKE